MPVNKKTSSSTASSKGVAIAKRAKISSAQKNMLIAVGLTSMLLGITVVGVIYLAKKISFNALIISENNKVVNDLKTTQNNLKSLSISVSELASNEKFEVVATERNKVKCDPETIKNISSDGGYDLDNIEIVRTCSALRVISDTLPSTMNQDASNSSINWLIIHNDDTIGLEGISSGSGGGEVGTIGDEQLNLGAIEASISIKDSATKINKVISRIESSIRNFDMTSASIGWADYDRGANNSEISFDATFRSYYSGKVGLKRGSKTICADKKSKKCVNAGGSE